MPTPPGPSTESLFDVLVALSLGEVETDTAAASLGLSLEAFVDLVEARTDLVRQAEERARALRQSPERTLQRSTAGLSAAVEVLAARIERDGDSMSSDELVKVSALLEKLIGLSEARKLELKAQTSAGEDGAALPCLILDARPHPVTGAARMAVYLVAPGGYGWVDFAKPEFQRPAFDWLEHYAPLDPVTGEPRQEAIEQLLHGIGRFMDSQGRIHG